MGWLTRLKRRAFRSRVEGVDGSFLPLEWNEHFARLSSAKRRAFAAELCRRVAAGADVGGEEVEQAIAALGHDQITEDRLRSIRSLVERFEREYDALVGDDESKLSCRDPEIAAAYQRMAAAWALRCALEGDLSGLAYYAWAVLDDLAEVRRLAGMPQASQESA
jgi:hypothetical protein